MRVFDAPGDYLNKFESLNGNYDYLMTSYFNDAYGQANFVGQNMNILLEDIELARKMGEAGKAEILNNFSIKKHINILDNLISNCQS